MRHQATVELDQKIVGQPVSAIDGLRYLQPAATGKLRRRFGRRQPVAPAGRPFAQHVEPVEDAARSHAAPALPPWPHGASVSPITGKQFVATLARQNDLETACARRLGQLEGRQDGVVGRGVVHNAGNARQQTPEIRLVERNLDHVGAQRAGDGACMGALVGHGRIVEAGGKGLHRSVVELRHQGEQDRTVDTARQEHAIRDIGALVHLDTVDQRPIKLPHRLVLA